MDITGWAKFILSNNIDLLTLEYLRSNSKVSEKKKIELKILNQFNAVGV